MTNEEESEAYSKTAEHIKRIEHLKATFAAAKKMTDYGVIRNHFDVMTASLPMFNAYPMPGNATVSRDTPIVYPYGEGLLIVYLLVVGVLWRVRSITYIPISGTVEVYR